MSEFKPGDIVQLKSGGPQMTVEQVGKTSITNEKVGSKQVVQRDTFPPFALKHYERPSVGVVSVRRG